MLAIRDENVVNAAQAARLGQGKGQLAPKTPGARYPKTPLRIPLNDENAIGGKTVLGTKGKSINIQQTGNKQSLVTPSETRARAPLGNKTTNAKARTGQTIGVKDIVKEFEKSQAKQTTIKRPKQKSPSIGPLKTAFHIDNSGPSDEPDIEYAPPKPKELPYESDVFPDGVLTFDGLKRENLFKGYYNHFYNPVGEDGVSLKDREHEERLQKALKENDDRILKDIEETDWSVSDVPETASLQKKKTAPVTNPVAVADKKAYPAGPKYPPTIASRRAASALAMPSSSSTVKQAKAAVPTAHTRKPSSFLLPGKKVARAPLPTKSSAIESCVADAASRSTIGYTKGRSASSILQERTTVPTNGQVFRTDRPTAGVQDMAARRTPEAHIQPTQTDESQELRRLQFLSIFDIDNEDDDGIGGTVPRDNDLEDDDFEMKLDL